MLLLPQKYKSILLRFFDKDTLPGDCHVATLLRMTNVKKSEF